jgi:hypothetical protein
VGVCERIGHVGCVAAMVVERRGDARVRLPHARRAPETARRVSYFRLVSCFPVFGGPSRPEVGGFFFDFSVGRDTNLPDRDERLLAASLPVSPLGVRGAFWPPLGPRFFAAFLANSSAYFRFWPLLAAERPLVSFRPVLGGVAACFEPVRVCLAGLGAGFLFSVMVSLVC